MQQANPRGTGLPGDPPFMKASMDSMHFTSWAFPLQHILRCAYSSTLQLSPLDEDFTSFQIMHVPA